MMRDCNLIKICHLYNNEEQIFEIQGGWSEIN